MDCPTAKRFVEVVSGKHDGVRCGGEVADERPEMRGGRGIEAAGGFVEKQDGRTFHERARQAETLIHSGREFHDERVGGIGEAGGGEQLVDAIRGRNWARNVVEGSEEVEILASGEARKKRALGRHGETDLAANVGGSESRCRRR